MISEKELRNHTIEVLYYEKPGEVTRKTSRQGFFLVGY